MKYVILIGLSFLGLSGFGQKSDKKDAFGIIGATMVNNDNSNSTWGVNLSGGFGTNVTGGASFDFFIFGDNPKFAIAAMDFRAWFFGRDKPVCPFLAVQPGWVIHNGTTGNIKTNGSFAVSFMGGAKIKPGKKSPGIILSAGYSSYSFKIEGSSEKLKNKGLKLLVGISL